MTGKPVSYHSDRCWVAASNAASIELEKKAFYAIILQTTEDIQPESFCFIICCHQILLATRQALKLFTHGWRLGCSQNCQTKHLSWATKTSSHSLLPASKLFLLWMASRRSGPLHIVWVFLSSSEAVESSCSQEECAYSWAAAYSMHWWCGVWWPRPSARDCSASQTALCCHFSRSSHNRLVSKLPLYIALGSPLVSVWTLYVGHHDSNPHTCWWGRLLSQTPFKKYPQIRHFCVGKDLGYIWHSFLRSMPYIVQS